MQVSMHREGCYSARACLFAHCHAGVNLRLVFSVVRKVKAEGTLLDGVEEMTEKPFVLAVF